MSQKRRRIDPMEDGIDDSLYSRQRYVLGDGAMLRMAKSTVFLSGLGGLGVEIAKNITLAGVKAVVLHDTVEATIADLATQFFLTETDVKSKANRAEASAKRVAELNPYVTVSVSTESLTGDLSFLSKYQVVILAEAPLAIQLAVDDFCRTHNPPIPFIAGEVRGVFSSLFVDAGPHFEVQDSTGEELKEVHLGDITQAEAGVVATLEKRLHEMQDGDHVEFREVQGMTELNGTVHKITVINPHSFRIGDTRAFSPYVRGGIARQLHRKLTVSHKSLREQLVAPSYVFVDAKIDAPRLTLLCITTMHAFRDAHGRVPRPWDVADADAFAALAAQHNDRAESKIELDAKFLRAFAFTCSGSLAGLTASLGGWAAQEAIKLLTGKFTPLEQFLLFDTMEVLPPLENPSVFAARGDRYDPQRICLGNAASDRLAGLRLFMVGCGAIGCELIKNFALMGVATAANGLATITDNDLIEKSNLNRQFLFRPHHIQQPKSVTAAAAAADINPGIRVKALQHKVCTETQTDIFNDGFFLSQDVVVNALDNIAARLYVDARCVTNQRPLLESGTLGTKGHVQVVVPFKTESYGSVRDPPEPDIPFCTLKSFPSNIEHTTQWAREKFGSLFEIKPAEFNKFWDDNGGVEAALSALAANEQSKTLSRVGLVRRLVANRPKSWHDCVALARAKFEKYFNHKARQLLTSFPPETALADGTPFWSPPKRQPTPLVFDPADPIHIQFVAAAAALFARVYGIHVPEHEDLEGHLQRVVPPPFVPKAKKIVTDESVKKTDAAAASQPAEDEDYPGLARYFRHQAETAAANGLARVPRLTPEIFEKDDDSNHHIDFISATANLRARMYSIESVDRLVVKRIAGKIVPAIATTTSAVSGLVAVELIKLSLGLPLESFKNAFLNLALPLMVFSEPAPVPAQPLSDGVSFTIWDRWEIHGSETSTLAQFVADLTARYKVQATGVFHGAAMIYVPAFPGQDKKLTKPMRKLIKAPGAPYVDLTVMVAAVPEEIAGPPVRFFFS
eukprot:m.230351 g.230351  ORF g.230351 m.230351 type:complete len:1021 (-) comp17989_c0_seq1:244-3306(-)